MSCLFFSLDLSHPLLNAALFFLSLLPVLTTVFLPLVPQTHDYLLIECVARTDKFSKLVLLVAIFEQIDQLITLWRVQMRR